MIPPLDNPLRPRVKLEVIYSRPDEPDKAKVIVLAKDDLLELHHKVDIAKGVRLPTEYHTSIKIRVLEFGGTWPNKEGS